MLHALPNPFDPFGTAMNALANMVQDLFKGLVSIFEQMIIHPPRPGPGSWQDELYGQGYGLALALVAGLSLIITVWAMIKQDRFNDLPIALGKLVLVGGLGYKWFDLCAWLTNAGAILGESAQFYHSTNSSGGGLLSIPAPENPLGAIAGLSTVMFFGFWLVGIFYAYQILIIFVTFLGLPAFALSALGGGWLKFWHWLVSLGLVSMVFGQPAAVLCLELSQIAIDHLPAGQSSFGASFYTCAGIALAVFVQFLLVLATHKVWQDVSGRVHSTVRGQVVAVRKQLQPNYQMVNAAHGNAMRPPPMGNVTMTNQLTSNGKQAAVGKAGDMVAKGAAAGAVALGAPELAPAAHASVQMVSKSAQAKVATSKQPN
jgi:hypothetical protein